MDGGRRSGSLSAADYGEAAPLIIGGQIWLPRAPEWSVTGDGNFRGVAMVKFSKRWQKIYPNKKIVDRVANMLNYNLDESQCGKLVVKAF